MGFLKFFFSELYARRRSIFMSVVIAFVAWIVAIIYTDRYSVSTIKNVPVVANLANTQIEQLGLDVVKIDPVVVSVRLKGPRHKLALCSKDDLVVAPISFKNINSDGNYELELKADLKQAQPDVVIDKIEPHSAVFSVDVLATKLVNVNGNFSNVQAEEGFVLDSPICQPTTLYVSGPKKFIDCLEEVQLNVDSMQKKLNSTKTFDAKAKFVASDGTELDSSIFKYNESVRFNVTFPTYRIKPVPLTFMFKNAPSCFNLNLLKFQISPDRINIGCPNEEIANGLKELSVGYIDMRQLDFETNFNFNVVVPSGCKNFNLDDSVSVRFDSSDWSSTTFVIDDIQLINADENFEVKIASAVLDKVKIVGLKNFIKNLTKEDITASVDLSGVKLTPGEHKVPVNIGILNKDGVWPVGAYKCTIYCKKLKS